MGKAKVLLMSQFKRIGRDSVLIMLMVYPFVLAIIGRYLVPIIKDATLSSTFNLQDHYHVLMIFFVIMNPVLFGDIIGLMLIDEREDNTLSAIRVLPIKMSNYIISKSTLFIILSIISGMLITWLINLYYVPIAVSFFINFVASLGVIFGMLLVNYFASNKVEGFAAMKGTGFILIIPVISIYIPHPFNYICGIVPAFWPAMALCSYYDKFAPTMSVWMYLSIGAAYILIISTILYKKIMRKILS
jgi:fluoroquinolone transport system permease protein